MADGRWNLPSLVAIFHFSGCPDRPSDGHVRKVADRYPAFGDEKCAAEVEYMLYRERITPLPAEPSAKLTSAKRALAAGNFRIAGDIGRLYQNGENAPNARDLASDGDPQTTEEAQAKIDKCLARLTPEEIAQMDRYDAAIRAGNYAAIPHMGEARPAPELADGAH